MLALTSSPVYSQVNMKALCMGHAYSMHPVFTSTVPFLYIFIYENTPVNNGTIKSTNYRGRLYR